MKNKNYKHTIFNTELINKSTVLELFDLLKDFEVYQKAYLRSNKYGKGQEVVYEVVIDNYHFEGYEKETKIFIIGLLLSEKKEKRKFKPSFLCFKTLLSCS